MQSIEWIIGLAFVLVCAVTDIRKREIPQILLVCGAVAVIAVRIVSRQDWQLYAGGAAIGFAFLVISKVTREGLGYGDSLLILILGLFLGLWRIIALLLTAFAAAAFFSIFLLAFKRMGRKQSFPFIPFLAVGYLGVMWL